jgi:carnosine synthase
MYDVVKLRRRLLCAFVTDNGPTRVPRFTETAAAMPSFLPRDKQCQLIAAAYKCCLEIGLVSGVFNVEMKMTSCGPRLIEINARMAGFYVRDWIRTVYSVDILFCAFAIACDVRPSLPRRLRAAGQMVGLMIVPSAHRHSAIRQPSPYCVSLRKTESSGSRTLNRRCRRRNTTATRSRTPAWR